MVDNLSLPLYTSSQYINQMQHTRYVAEERH